MIRINVREKNKNSVINMVSSIIELDGCEEILIKTKEDLLKTESPPVIDVRDVCEILKNIGIPCHIAGYRYIQEAVAIVKKEPYKMNGIVKIVYSEIAAKSGTTSIRVERAIRHAIEKGFTYGDSEEIYKYFGSSYSKDKGKPTNKEFIAMLVKLMKEDRNEN